MCLFEGTTLLVGFKGKPKNKTEAILEGPNPKTTLPFAKFLSPIGRQRSCQSAGEGVSLFPGSLVPSPTGHIR